MKFQIAKQDLDVALATVGGALASSPGDISSHYVFRISLTDDTKVEILAASNRVYASCPVAKAVVMEVGEPFTVEGWRLKGWVSNVGDAALTVETNPANAEVTVTAGKYTQTFRSLDYKNFTVMDKTLEKAELKATIPAKRLTTALKSAKAFASDDDSNQPEVVVVDVRNGLLMATDKRSVAAFFTVQGLEDCNMRVHAKDVSALCGFLDGIDGEVEILDSKRVVFFRRKSDGALYGETRYQVEFPNLTFNVEPDQRTWTVKTAELRRAAMTAYYGASKTDNRLFFIPPNDEGVMKVAMKTDTNTGKMTLIPLAAEVAVNDPNSTEPPEGGFPVSHEHVLALLDAVGTDETVALGINVNATKKNRFVRVTRKVFADAKDPTVGDSYTYVLAGMIW